LPGKEQNSSKFKGHSKVGPGTVSKPKRRRPISKHASFSRGSERERDLVREREMSRIRRLFQASMDATKKGINFSIFTHSLIQIVT